MNEGALRLPGCRSSLRWRQHMLEMGLSVDVRHLNLVREKFSYITVFKNRQVSVAWYDSDLQML